MATQHPVEPVVTVEQQGEDRGAEAVWSVRHERGRHAGAELGEERGRIIDLELAVRRLVHGQDVTRFAVAPYA